MLASWAFLFLIAPLLVAFGLVRDVPWHFYPLTVLLIGLFIILPGVLGAALAIVHRAASGPAQFPNRCSSWLALVLLALAAFWWKAQSGHDELLDKRTLEALDQLLAKTRFTMFPFLPSYWLSSSVLQWAEGILRQRGVFRAGAVEPHAVFRRARLHAVWQIVLRHRLGGAKPRRAADSDGIAVRAPESSPARPARSKGSSRNFSGSTPDTRALAVKDLRMFWRDTTQWGQSVMFFGLLGVYIINLRNFTHQLTSPFWINAVAFLNLGACAFNLASVTTRFVFPQFSLEGRRMWIIGLLPMGLARVVKTKYWLASALSLVVTLGLVTLSCYLLKMPWDDVAFFGAVVTVMTFALNGLAVGLGVLYPNIKETNPNKIVSGFGGTLCFVLSSVYIIAALALLVLGQVGPHSSSYAADGVIGFFMFHATYACAACVLAFVLLSVAIGWLPMKLALRQLENFEA